MHAHLVRWLREGAKTFFVGLALAILVALVLVPVLLSRVDAADPVSVADTAVLSDDPDGALEIVAMGDSYMSGEGARRFYAGTDVGKADSCRRAPTAYPVLLAEHLAKSPVADAAEDWNGVHLTFVACSGAITTNIGSRFTDPDAKPHEQNSTEPLQIDALRRVPDPDVVILGMGGNDAGFSNVVLTCSGHKEGCVAKAGPWLSALDPRSHLESGPTDDDGLTFVQQKLRDVLDQVKELAPSARVYVTTYPNPLSAASCPDIGMDAGETRFLREVFLPQLNDEISLAATLEGVETIDLFHVFDGMGLCANGEHQHGPAVNDWRWQRTEKRTFDPNALLRGSMHPTEAGHALIEAAVEAQVRDDLTRPGPNTPEIGGVPPGCPPTLPPGESPGTGPGGPPDQPPGCPPPELPDIGTLPPVDVPFPEGPWPMRDNTCATEATRNDNVDRADGPMRVDDAMPGTTACFAEYAQDFTEAGPVGSDGTLTVTTSKAVSGLGGRRELLYEDKDGDWTWRIEWPAPGTPSTDLGYVQAWVGQPTWVVVLMAAAGCLLLGGLARAARLVLSTARR